MINRRLFFPVAAMTIAAVISGCHSYRIDTTVENRTGAAIDLLEVDYPSASFGVDQLAAGATYRYRFEVRGQGPILVQYNDSATHQLRQMTGPKLFERQEGRLDIVLLPNGKVDFRPELTQPQK